MKPTTWIAIAGILGFAAVLLGAFGAHALPGHLSDQQYAAEEAVKRIATFETGARYHMYAALVILAVGVAKQLWPATGWNWAGGLLLTGGVLFSHLCYALAWLGPDWRWLGAVVPIGGLMMMSGWLAILVTALRTKKTSRTAERLG